MDKNKIIDENNVLKKEVLQEESLYIEDVRQGIIWSQILENPRSKNPYFFSKGYKYNSKI